MAARYGYAHRKARAYLIAQARVSPTPVVCWRCELPITTADLDTVEAGHVIDAALMAPGTAPRLRLEHRACNRAAGYALGQEMARASVGRVRRPSAAWSSTELGR
jgi:hypothetical protein